MVSVLSNNAGNFTNPPLINNNNPYDINKIPVNVSTTYPHSPFNPNPNTFQQNPNPFQPSSFNNNSNFQNQFNIQNPSFNNNNNIQDQFNNNNNIQNQFNNNNNIQNQFNNNNNIQNPSFNNNNNIQNPSFNNNNNFQDQFNNNINNLQNPQFNPNNNDFYRSAGIRLEVSATYPTPNVVNMVPNNTYPENSPFTNQPINRNEFVSGAQDEFSYPSSPPSYYK
jgi:hypothetical protein